MSERLPNSRELEDSEIVSAKIVFNDGTEMPLPRDENGIFWAPEGIDAGTYRMLI